MYLDPKTSILKKEKSKNKFLPPKRVNPSA